ncbi:putative ankyrin repeat domain containing protein [Venturia nashicola]|nr:putative ankyrin repeat domain containing protein [Venturia nashicola]
MLEYLSSAKTLEHGFTELANDFLELSRTLWAVEAGVSEASQTDHRIPFDMNQDLLSKIQKTNDDFSVLNQLCVKFVESANKGRFHKGWRLFFLSTDIEKMRSTLQKNKEFLKMSVVIFRWSVGDTKAEPNAGIGYTALVAALERLNSTRPTTAIPPLSSPSSSETMVDTVHDISPPRISSKTDQTKPIPTYDNLENNAQTHPSPSPFSEDSNDGKHRYHGVTSSDRSQTPPTGLGSLPTRTLHSLERSVSNQGHEHFSTFSDATLASTILLDPALLHASFGESRHESRHRSVDWSIRDFPLPVGTPAWSQSNLTTTVVDPTQLPTIHDISSQTFKYPTTFKRLKVDLTAIPRWTPRPGLGASIANSSAMLSHAIQQRDRSTAERLLDFGAEVGDANLLVRACLNGDVEIVRLLLLFGADPNLSDKKGYTPLYAAAKTSFLEVVELLIKYGADPNMSAGPDEESPLVTAVQKRNFELEHLLLMFGADPCAIMACGNTPLIKVIDKSVPERFIQLMLDYDADPNAKDREGATALFKAIQVVRMDLMNLLFDHGADPNLPAPKHPLWPSTYHAETLHLMLSRGADTRKAPGLMELASSLKNIESVSVLLGAGVSPNIKKDGIYTPLCSAIRDNSVDIVELLLANGADPNLPASEYPHFKCITHKRLHILPKLIAAGADLHRPKGILECAVSHDNMEALHFLLTQGVHLNDRNEEGCTALTTAIRDNKIAMLDLLLANGADPNFRGEDWPLTMAVKTPSILRKLLKAVHNPSSVRGVIEAAVMANQLESIKMLLKAGVSVEDKTGGVFSPLTTALREDRNDLVRFLLYKAGADPNAPGEHLPLIKAIRRCKRNDTECIEMLLDRGADINKMYRGWNAILQAVESGNMKILKLLLREGNCVDLMVRDETGRCVGDIVKERGWIEGVSLLFPEEDFV